MALDFNEALNEYGYVAVFAQSQPELAAKLQQAVAEEWNSARFEREIMNTGWWKVTSERQRALQLQQSTDPASYGALVEQKRQAVILAMGQQGRSDPSQVEAITAAALVGEWSDDYLNTVIARSAPASIGEGGALTGAAGEIQNHLLQSFDNYGVSYSDQQLNNLVSAVQAGSETLGGLDNRIRGLALAQYPQFKDQINSGQTVRDIADPYMATMANTLEIAQTSVKLNDPAIKRALTTTDGTQMPMWQFERSLKDDARWDKTKQARNDTYGIVQQVGKDWGFLA